MANLSAILITKNEALNIKRCLDSITWIEEVILLDTFSTDHTLEIAKNFDNVRVYQHPWIGFTENKKIALNYTSNDWVLWIDADEEISEALRKEIKDLIKENIDHYDILDFPRKTYFLGTWIKHTGWYPGRVKRLFNKKKCTFNSNLLHEGLDIPASALVGHLESDLHHFSYPDLYQYFNKMNYYGKYGAEELLRKKKKFYFYQLLINPAMTFIKFFLLKKGFMDGKNGFIIAVGSAFSNFIKYTNYYYLLKDEKNNHKQNR